jgi:hypothetical protein
MRNTDDPVEPRSEEHADPLSAPAAAGAGTSVTASLGEALVPAALAVTAGGVVLVVAVAFGAAEAAVGVGAAYLVYSAVVGRGDLSGLLAVRFLTGALRRPPAANPSGPSAD